MHPANIDSLVPLLIVLDLVELSLSLPLEFSMLSLKISQLFLDLLSLLLPLRESLIEGGILLVQPLDLVFEVLNLSLQLFLIGIGLRVIIIEFLLKSSMLDSLIHQVLACVGKKLS